MNILFINIFFVRFMVYEILSVRIRALSVFGYFPLYISIQEFRSTLTFIN